MVKHMFPPKGYRAQEYPLPHAFDSIFQLSAEDASKDSTLLTLLRSSEVATGVEAIEVNPRNPNFAEDTGPLIHNGSLVPKMSFKLTAKMSKVAETTDGMRAVTFSWFPIYIAFLDSLTASDDKTGVEVEDILELQHETTNKDTYPLNTAGKLIGAEPVNLSNIVAAEAFGDYGLSASTQREAVAFDQNLFYQALSYYTNKGMLSKVIGKVTTFTLHRDNIYKYFSNNFTYPSVKRGNPYTFCGIMVYVHQVNKPELPIPAAEVTAISHVNFGFRVRFNEWNPLFDQGVV